MPRLVLVVPDVVPHSLNRFLGRSGWAYRREKARWMRLLSDAHYARLVASGRQPGPAWPTPPIGQVRCTIDRITPRADALDPDNAAGAVKPLLDALRGLSLLADDTAAALDLVVRQPKGAPRERLTRVTLEL